jgi:hypothetical protein
MTMAENVEITVADSSGYLVNDLNRCRQAITYRGGTVSAKEGLRDIPDSIANIPLSSSIGTVTDDSLDSIKLIPPNSVPACYIKSIGGMTYKCKNLMPFPYYGVHGEMQIGKPQALGGLSVVANSDKSLSITKEVDVTDDSFRLDISGLTTSDYYLTVLYNGADFFGVSSNVGNIPFNTSVFIPSTIGITYIDIYSTLESEGHGTISIILGKEPYKEPYFEGLSDTKTTAVKVHGSNLFDYTKAFADWLIFNYSKEGDTITLNHKWGEGFSWRYKFADEPKICTISVDASSTSADGVRLSLVCVEDGVAKTRANLFLGRDETSVTSTGVVNEIRWDYPKGVTDVVSTLKGLRINYGSADCGYYPYHEEPITYEIPEELQGTGKGVDGAADTVDFENGKKITNIGEADLGDLNWTIASYGFYSYGLKTKFIGNLILSADYTTDTWSNVYSEKTDRSISGNGQAIIISDSRYTDEASFKASLVGKKILYALAEPIVEDIDTSIFNNIPTVEPGGYLEFVTDNGFAPNSSVLFQTIP